MFNPWKIFCNPGFHEVFLNCLMIVVLQKTS